MPNLSEAQKRTAVFLLCLCLAICFPAAIYAADAAASITYSDRKQGFQFQPGSVYSSSDLFVSFKDVMPGDSIRQQIRFVNSAQDCPAVRLYLQAIPHSPDSNPVRMVQNSELASWQGYPEMQQFLAQLTLSVWDGNALLSSGTADQTAGLTNPVLLGTFAPGEEALLTVQLDADPLIDNNYAHRAGEIDWQFLIECCSDPIPPSPSPAVHPHGCGKLIQTGQLSWPIPLLAAAGLALLFLAHRCGKKH